MFDDQAEDVYLSNEIKLLDGRLTVTPGLRYEHARMEFSGSGSGSVSVSGVQQVPPPPGSATCSTASITSAVSTPAPGAASRHRAAP
ncbi:hypothetical protein [Pseudomonas sp.]|uniref:hypothetical protein n=1 Tax=Pseudomonas sp. TaxID=306 RepID=UPI0039AEB035